MSWRVRLRGGTFSGSGKVLGAGVLLGTDRVLTCAHVIRDPDTGQRPERIQVDFPMLQGLAATERRTATVLDGHWVPPFGKEQGDLALLALDRAAPVASPARFHRMLDYRGAPVHIAGFPAGKSGGDSVTGACMGPGGHGDERVQIALGSPDRRMPPGFSGAGVVEAETGRLLGIVVRAARQDAYGYMIPAATIAKYFADVGRAFVSGPPVIPGRHIVPSEAARTAVPHGIQRTVTRWLHGEPGAWDVEVLFVDDADTRARQALRLVLNMADREQSPHLSTAPAAAGSPDRSGAPHLSAAGVQPRAGTIAAVVDLEGTSLEDPRPRATREALEALRREAASLSGRGARPAVAVLGADRSTTDPATAVRMLRELSDQGVRLLLEIKESDRGFAYETARLLLPADRARCWLERLTARADLLAAAEERSRYAYRRVERHVVDPPSPTGHGPRAQLWTVQLANEVRALSSDASDGNASPSLLERLSRAEQSVETRLLRAEAVERSLDAILERHLALRALLALHQKRLADRGLGEHPDAVRLFAPAQQLLMGDPCPLPDAERAVEAFIRTVRRLLDGPDEGGDPR